MLSIAGLSVLWACTTTGEEATAPPSESPINVVKDGVLSVGPEGGGFRSPDGVLSVIIAPDALAETVDISIVAIDRIGAKGTPIYRVDLTPPTTTLAKPAIVTMDLSGETAIVAEIGDGANLRIASDAAVMKVHGRASADAASEAIGKALPAFVGITFDLNHEIGLTEIQPQGRAGGPLPTCVAKCLYSSPLVAIEGGACGGAILEGKAQSCLQSCDAASLATMCIPAPSIDCGGTSCTSCCLLKGKLACDPSCATTTGKIEGKVTVDCLGDRDCGTGLSCCVPQTERGGGTLIIKDSRITCKASCEGEQLHLCDVNDTSDRKCESCEAARTSCSRGFCGKGTTAAAVVCPL